MAIRQGKDNAAGTRGSETLTERTRCSFVAYSRPHPALYPFLQLLQAIIAPRLVTGHLPRGETPVHVYSAILYVLVGREIDPVRFHAVYIDVAKEGQNISGKAESTDGSFFLLSVRLTKRRNW